MAKDKKNKDNKENSSASYFGGLTFKQFKDVGKRGWELNDISWAGRLYSKYPYWFKRLSQLTMILLFISVASLAVIWGSIFMRTPALLLGVYPEGQVVCFPRLIKVSGARSELHPSYADSCSMLDKRAGMMWQTENPDAVSDVEAVGNLSNKVQYKTIDDVIREKQNFPVVQPQFQPAPLSSPLSATELAP